MADTKISALTAIGTLGADDVFAVVDDPGGSPLSRKVTGQNLKTYTLIADQYSADAVDRELTFNKSRNATVGSHTIVAADDDLGTIRFQGSNGTTFDTAAFIMAEVDGTPGATTDMPGRLVLATTPDASATPQERLRIDNAGRLIFTGGSQGGASRDVQSGVTADFQIYRNNIAPIMSFTAWFASTLAPSFFFAHSRSDTAGTHTVLSSGDEIGSFVFSASDGDEFLQSAKIGAKFDGTGGNADVPGRLEFSTTSDGGSSVTERMRIGSAGNTWMSDRVVVTATASFGTTFVSTSGNTGVFQLIGDSGATTEIDIGRFSADAQDGHISFNKSRHATIGSHTVVTSGDDLGTITWGGSDGDQFVAAARIIGQSDGTPGDNDMPGRLVFYTTPDASATPAERLRITSTGRMISTTGQVAHFWVYWTANSTTILASHNVASIDDDATGDAGVNLTTAFSSNNFAAHVTPVDTSGGWDTTSVQCYGINVHTASVVDVILLSHADGTTSTLTTADPDQWSVCGFGVSAKGIEMADRDLIPHVVTVVATRADGGLTVSRFVAQDDHGRPRDITPEYVNEIYGRRGALIADGKKQPGEAIISWEFVPNDYVGEETDRTFRNAWKHNRGGKKPDHDMPKAREIHRVYLRKARLPEFCRLDNDYRIADEAGDQKARKDIGALRQKFRDVTEDPRIEAAKTVEELKALRLEALVPETKGVNYMVEKMRVSPAIPGVANKKGSTEEEIMAGWVFKLKGLGADATIIRTYTLNDAATTRALDKHRTPPETNEQVLVRLWDKFVNENVVDADYLVRKNDAVTAAASGVTKATTVVTSTDV